MTTCLVDTNVLIDIFTVDPTWYEWSARTMAAVARAGQAVINPVIYAEVSTPFDSVELLDQALARLDLPLVQFTTPALFLAGRAFGLYRRRGGVRSGMLADFLIGAHAATAGLTLVTRDLRRRAYFPAVTTISP